MAPELDNVLGWEYAQKGQTSLRQVKSWAWGLPTHQLLLGPWEGSMRSVAADQVPIQYMAGGSDFLYQPRTGFWKRRLGQIQKFDTFGASVGMLPAKWGAKCRQLEEFTSESISDGVPSVIALLTKETMGAGVIDDGAFSQVWLRDQVNNQNYTLGQDYGASTYPAPGGTQYYRFVPLWYESGDGGITRGTAEFARRFFVSGSRKLFKVGKWWYFPTRQGTPSRWRGTYSTASGTQQTHPNNSHTGGWGLTAGNTQTALASNDGDTSVVQSAGGGNSGTGMEFSRTCV